MDEATLTELLNNVDMTSVTGASPASLFDMDALIQTLAPYLLVGTILSGLLVVLYIISIISKWRANKAIVDIKKLLIQMNERDKLRDTAARLQPVEAAASATSAPAGDSPDVTPLQAS